MFWSSSDVTSFDGADVGALASAHACSNTLAYSFPDASSHSRSFAGAFSAAIAASFSGSDSTPKLTTDSSSCGEANTSADPIAEHSAELSAYSRSQPASDASTFNRTVVLSFRAAFSWSEFAAESGSVPYPKPGAIERSESIADPRPLIASFVSSEFATIEYSQSSSESFSELDSFPISDSTSFSDPIFDPVCEAQSYTD